MSFTTSVIAAHARNGLRSIQALPTRSLVKIAAVYAVFAMLAAPVFAQANLDTVTGGLLGQLGNLGPLITAVFAIVGLVLVGMGIMKLFSAKNNPQESKMGGVLMILGGAFLLIILVIINLTTQTVFGVDGGTSTPINPIDSIF